VKITVTVNGTDHARVVEPRLLLIHFLRDELGLTGSHWGCDTSNCGACVVWLDETPVKSCTVLAVMADGRRVTTVEGLATRTALDPVQEAFAACHGLQCGFCTPGMLMTARWLLDTNPDPTEAEVREAISGQVCRCTGYENIVKSVLWAAKHEGGADEPRLRAAPAVYLVERLTDMLARELGMGPAELQMRNLLGPSSSPTRPPLGYD
jgi:carbon-monoxide dehydrogenase small subunit